MPTVRPENQVVAILCSDVHLSLKAPVARAGEEDWFAAQKRPWDEVKKLRKKHGGCYVICAGDLFDRWNSSAELINFAMDILPDMYSIPGQHDLPHHDYNAIEKSAYHTLEKSEILTEIPSEGLDLLGMVCVYGFPWNKPVHPPLDWSKDLINVAIIHQYSWIKGKSYPGAPKENKLGSGRKDLEGYDVVHYGDNHKGFLVEYGNTTVINTGTFLRRKSDEMDYKPQVGLLYGDGHVEVHLLDTSKDNIVKTFAKKQVEEDLEIKEFIEGLNQLEDTCLDFEEVMKRILDKKKPRQQVREIIMEAME